uniref:Uncharacterized protein n=1 Tax=Anguilla anguilla TaxID=7936 RepID=A0A0E9RL07_ANGAN
MHISEIFIFCIQFLFYCFYCCCFEYIFPPIFYLDAYSCQFFFF